jgi:hypothetical protein
MPMTDNQRMETPHVLDRWFNILGSPQGFEELHPVQVAEYALVNKILEEPAFAWWATRVLHKCDQIIKKVKSRY